MANHHPRVDILRRNWRRRALHRGGPVVHRGRRAGAGHADRHRPAGQRPHAGAHRRADRRHHPAVCGHGSPAWAWRSRRTSGTCRGSPAVEIVAQVAAALPEVKVQAVEPHAPALPEARRARQRGPGRYRAGHRRRRRHRAADRPQLLPLRPPLPAVRQGGLRHPRPVVLTGCDNELGSRIEGDLGSPADDEVGTFPRPLAGDERVFLGHPVAVVLHGRRPAGCPTGPGCGARLRAGRTGPRSLRRGGASCRVGPLRRPR